MKVLITGNLGYVGSELVKHLKSNIEKINITGLDTGYFENYVSSAPHLPKNKCDEQIKIDIRKLSLETLDEFDIYIFLAAVSNDPIGQKFKKATEEINVDAHTRIINYISALSQKTIIFASSCSVYGAGGDVTKKEFDRLEPLTTYAHSKTEVENLLKKTGSLSNKITCLRFATACGMSDKLRLDLVLNDFVASAMLYNSVNIQSDGTPWRPLIDVSDMARAIEWAIKRPKEHGGSYLSLNVGKNDWNFKINELAEAVQKYFPTSEIKFTGNNQPDKRSYKVDFSLFKRLAPSHQPVKTLTETIEDLAIGIEGIIKTGQNDKLEDIHFVRLKSLENQIELGLLSSDLYWT